VEERRGHRVRDAPMGLVVQPPSPPGSHWPHSPSRMRGGSLPHREDQPKGQDSNLTDSDKQGRFTPQVWPGRAQLRRHDDGSRREHRTVQARSLLRPPARRSAKFCDVWTNQAAPNGAGNRQANRAPLMNSIVRFRNCTRTRTYRGRRLK
jgi:hypothetical protein